MIDSGFWTLVLMDTVNILLLLNLRLLLNLAETIVLNYLHINNLSFTSIFFSDPNVTNVCPYALNVYDLHTDQRIRRYVFRPEDIVPSTFIANIALDEGHTCDDTFAYFSDELGYGLIAYSWEQNKSWRFSHSYFMPDPLVGDFNIAGLNFQWGAEGIFGISAGPMGADGFRTLYFSPITSFTEFSVSTKILRDESKVTGSYHDFNVVGIRGPDTHTTAKVMDSTGVQLFALIDQNAIGCWNTQLSLKPQNVGVVDKDDVALIFPCDVKIDDNRNVWVISDRMSTFLESQLNYGEINFRIFVAPFEKLTEGTVCQSTAPAAQTPKLFPNYAPQSQFFNPPHLESISQIPSHIFLPTTSSKTLTSPFNSFSSKYAFPKATTSSKFSKQPSQPYYFSSLQSHTTTQNPWWLQNNY